MPLSAIKNGMRQGSLAVRSGFGSGSDSEGGMRVKKKLANRIAGSADGTPRGSRAGSPAVGASQSRTASRAGSPSAPGNRAAGEFEPHVKLVRHTAYPIPATPAPGAATPLPDQEEILRAIPENGITLGALTAQFKARVHQTKIQDFIALVRSLTRFDKETKTVRRR